MYHRKKIPPAQKKKERATITFRSFSGEHDASFSLCEPLYLISYSIKFGREYQLTIKIGDRRWGVKWHTHTRAHTRKADNVQKEGELHEGEKKRQMNRLCINQVM